MSVQKDAFVATIEGCGLNFERWLDEIILARSAAEILSVSAGIIARLARNVAAWDFLESEARRAAESQVLTIRKIACRASAVPDDFRPWGPEESIRATAGSKEFARAYARDVVRHVWGEKGKGRRDLLKKADRALKSEEQGWQWANSEPLAPWLEASIMSWCIQPHNAIPPVCVLASSAIAEVFSPTDHPPSDMAVRKALHRWGLYHPKGPARKAERFIRHGRPAFRFVVFQRR